MNPPPHRPTHPITTFFAVLVRPQTYRNLVYLLLAFPLGLFYFLFLVIGLTLGLGLSIVWVGVLILALVMAGWYGLAAFERKLAIGLLREAIPPMARADLAALAPQMSLWSRFTGSLTNPVTWKSLFYLAARFPLGILSFVLLVTLLSVSFGFIAAPFYALALPPRQDLFLFNRPLMDYAWLVHSPVAAVLLSLAGIFLLVLSMHIFNGLAWFSGKFARVMLGNFQPVPPAQPPARIIPPPVYAQAPNNHDPAE